MNRLPYLDYLRGIAALLIMVYHFILFTIGKPDTNSFLNKTGLYGVSVFYVLSGLTLYHVYNKTMKPDGRDLIVFFAKRFFRIFPLLWLVTFATIYLKGFRGFEILFLNLTGLFGLVKPSAYIATGVWSIGNELVFYLFFPLLIFLLKQSRSLFFIVSGVILACYLYFAFIILPASGGMAAAWKTYINPLNQAFLFLCGFIIGSVFRDSKISQPLLLSIFLLVLGIYNFYPVHGNSINLVIGETRLIYTILSIAIVFCAYKFELLLPAFVNKPLVLLGEISYGLYLLHPVVLIVTQIIFGIIAKYFFAFPLSVVLACSGIGSLIISFLVYKFFEKPFVRLGNRLIAHSNDFFSR